MFGCFDEQIFILDEIEFTDRDVNLKIRRSET